ncbi:MAG: fibrobacter succinogenes major paralogous domain-containing protein [Bacteroidetes bacterium]|nr:fibrobacter succinogenes major paralogous domain-containing protein [Bacteroidota bacterium]
MKRKTVSLSLILLTVFAGLLLLQINACKKSSDDNTPPSAGIKDFDGNVYHTVTIGQQVWLVENLKATHYRNGDPVNKAQLFKSGFTTDTSGAYLNYRNSDSIAQIYGRLYNFWAGTDPRGLAPVGFHVPSDAEWSAMEAYLGNDSLTGGKLKETGTTHWASPNINATNSSGFTALPAGSYAGFFGYVGLGNWTSLWTSTSTSTWYADARGMVNTTGIIGGANLGDGCKLNFFSIRCVQDPLKK